MGALAQGAAARRPAWAAGRFGRLGGLVRQPAPVLVAAAVVLAAWVALLLVGGHGFAGHEAGAARDGGAPSAPATHEHHHGMDAGGGMSRAGAAGAGHHGGAADAGGGAGHDGASASHDAPALAAALPLWLLMTVAMMSPSALPALQHVARNSLRWRRGRASAQFAAVYLALWTAFGAAVLLARPLWEDAEPELALAVALAVAAAWQLTAAKRRALNDCHRSSPLPPRGWPAMRGVARFGGRNGGACVRSCWPLMLAMAVVPAAHLAWMAALTALVTAEKLALRPRRVTRGAAALLGVAAAGAALVAAAG